MYYADQLSMIVIFISHAFSVQMKGKNFFTVFAIFRGLSIVVNCGPPHTECEICHTVRIFDERDRNFCRQGYFLRMKNCKTRVFKKIRFPGSLILSKLTTKNLKVINYSGSRMTEGDEAVFIIWMSFECIKRCVKVEQYFRGRRKTRAKFRFQMIFCLTFISASKNIRTPEKFWLK